MMEERIHQGFEHQASSLPYLFPIFQFCSVLQHHLEPKGTSLGSRRQDQRGFLYQCKESPYPVVRKQEQPLGAET